MKDLNQDFKAKNDIIIENILKNIDLGCKFDSIPFIRILEEITSGDVLSHTLKVIKSLNILLSGDLKRIETLGDGGLSVTSLRFLKEIGESAIDEEVRSLLKLSALYHDIGKIIRKPRHAQQGYYLFEIDTENLYSADLDKLKSYLGGFLPEDEIEYSLHFIGQMIRYHDLIGTLSTGESSYLLLLHVLNNPMEFEGNSRSAEGNQYKCLRFLQFPFDSNPG